MGVVVPKITFASTGSERRYLRGLFALCQTQDACQVVFPDLLDEDDGNWMRMMGTVIQHILRHRLIGERI